MKGNIKYIVRAEDQPLKWCLLSSEMYYVGASFCPNMLLGGPVSSREIPDNVLGFKPVKTGHVNGNVRELSVHEALYYFFIGEGQECFFFLHHDKDCTLF